MDPKRKLLIKKLLATQHLNVPERKELGQSPSFREVVEAADAHFKDHRYLPASVTKWEPDKFCYEGFVLEKLNDAVQPYNVLYQEVGPWLDLRASTSTKYPGLEDALIVYLQKAYRNSIDGIEIAFD